MWSRAWRGKDRNENQRSLYIISTLCSVTLSGKPLQLVNSRPSNIEMLGWAGSARTGVAKAVGC